jgi:hypothetical protein
MDIQAWLLWSPLPRQKQYLGCAIGLSANFRAVVVRYMQGWWPEKDGLFD